MKKVCGFAMFWTAVGMFLMMLISNVVWGVILIAALLLVGYKLFFC